MKTARIPGRELSRFDEEILQKLGPKADQMRTVRRERIIVGIRNHRNEIYRVIGIPDQAVFLDAITHLNSLSLIDQLGSANEPKQGYHAIFAVR